MKKYDILDENLMQDDDDKEMREKIKEHFSNLNKHSDKWKNLEIQYNKDEFDISCEPIESCFCTKEQLRQLEQEFI